MKPGFEFLPLAEVREFVENYDETFSTMTVQRTGEIEPSGLMLISATLPDRNTVLTLNEAGEAPAFEARAWADATHMAVLDRKYGS
jgi:hypothetical protein